MMVLSTPKKIFRNFTIACLSVLLCISGCQTLGPRKINADRSIYDDAVRNTNHQQILKNIVLLRYGEPISFLKLTNITASYNFTLENNPNANFSWTDNPNAVTVPGAGRNVLFTRGFTLNPRTSYSNTPTMSYVPLENAEFVKGLLTPISLQQLLLLTAGGIQDPILLLRLVVLTIDGLDNASTVAPGRLTSLPNYKEFYHFLGLMSKVLKDRQCMLLPTPLDKTFAITMHCQHDGQNIAELQEIRRMLGIPASNKADIVISESAVPNAPSNYVYIQLRSIYGILSLLSYSVEIPPEDITAGYIRVLLCPNGQPFNWDPLMHGIMKIYSSDRVPADAFVKVMVHDHWFYILNSDVESKLTFSLIERLLAMTSGQDVQGAIGPVVTIPASRPLGR